MLRNYRPVAPNTNEIYMLYNSCTTVGRTGMFCTPVICMLYGCYDNMHVVVPVTHLLVTGMLMNMLCLY